MVEYLVMQAEHIVIDANVIEFDVPLYVVQDIKHIYLDLTCSAKMHNIKYNH